jgi:hypothetical protein
VISAVSKVVLGVRVQDRAKEFWTESIGFELVQDPGDGQERWVEVRSPDGTAKLTSASDREGTSS